MLKELLDSAHGRFSSPTQSLPEAALVSKPSHGRVGAPTGDVPLGDTRGHRQSGELEDAPDTADISIAYPIVGLVVTKRHVDRQTCGRRSMKLGDCVQSSILASRKHKVFRGSHPPESNRRPTDYERTQHSSTATTKGREMLGSSVRLANPSLEDAFTNRHVKPRSDGRNVKPFDLWSEARWRTTPPAGSLTRPLRPNLLTPDG